MYEGSLRVFFFLPQPCRQKMYPTTESASNLPIEIRAVGHGWEYSTMVKRAGVGRPQLRAESPPHPHYAFLLLIQPWQAISLLSQSLSFYICEVGLLKLHCSIVYVVTGSWVSYWVDLFFRLYGHCGTALLNREVSSKEPWTVHREELCPGGFYSNDQTFYNLWAVLQSWS